MKIDTSSYDYSKAGWYSKTHKPDHDQTFEPYSELVWVEYAYGEEGRRHCAWWKPIPKNTYYLEEKDRNGFGWWGPVLGDFESLEAMSFEKGPTTLDPIKEI